MTGSKERSEYSYFAASNSFDGFTSYFRSCFSPLDYDKIYVIKGGPGTGKSTLMKKASSFASEQGYAVEEIYCSSDVNSLDGVIIENRGKKVAMLDGTAPHETDATLPGVVEELINLGDYWDEEYLKKRKPEIVNLNSKKNAFFTKAYDELSDSAFFARKTRAEISKYFDFDSAEDSVNLLCRAVFSKDNGQRKIRLISAFGKDGYVRFDTLDKTSERIYNVSGIYGSEYLFMNILRANLLKTDTDLYILPSPLDKNNTEAIYIPNLKCSIIVNAKSGTKIDTSDFINRDALLAEESRIKEYLSLCEDFLEKAKSNFILASKYHFELESIYSPSVDFGKINILGNNILDEIKEILS